MLLEHSHIALLAITLKFVHNFGKLRNCAHLYRHNEVERGSGWFVIASVLSSTRPPVWSKCLLWSLAISLLTQRQRVPRLRTRDLAASVESGRCLIPLLERELAKAFLRSVLAACTISGSGAQTCWPSGSTWSCLSRWKSRPGGACKALTQQMLKALILEAKLVATECLYSYIYLNVFIVLYVYALCMCL